MTNTNQSGSIIPLNEATQYTHDYQSLHPDSHKSYYVGKSKLEQLLNQEGCMGMRIYMGYNSQTQKENLVLVGVDEYNEDMTNGVILENLVICPSMCPKKSQLMKF